MPTKTQHHLPCGFVENDIIAVALGDALPALQKKVRQHLAICSNCVQRLEQYQHISSQLSSLPVSEADLSAARNALDTQLAQHLEPTRPRLVLSVWDSPIGPLRIGRTEKGVALIEFISPDDAQDGRTKLETNFAVEQSEGTMATLTRNLEAYLSGSRQALDWAIDDALMRSDFQRQVLEAASEVPYGTLTTYLGIAERIQQPKAVRAVAQALRYNPVPIQIPCHRIIGSNGNLTGYAGNKIDLKRQILTVEGIPTVQSKTGVMIAQDQLYVGRQHDLVFCRPSCKVPKETSARDRLFIASQARAEEIGYAPCHVCQPDLHPAREEAEPSLF